MHKDSAFSHFYWSFSTVIIAVKGLIICCSFFLSLCRDVHKQEKCDEACYQIADIAGWGVSVSLYKVMRKECRVVVCTKQCLYRDYCFPAVHVQRLNALARATTRARARAHTQKHATNRRIHAHTRMHTAVERLTSTMAYV